MIIGLVIYATLFYDQLWIWRNAMTLNHLPIEMIQHILSFAPIDTLKATAVVNKTYHHLSYRALSLIYQRKFKQQEQEHNKLVYKINTNSKIGLISTLLKHTLHNSMIRREKFIWQQKEVDTIKNRFYS